METAIESPARACVFRSSNDDDNSMLDCHQQSTARVQPDASTPVQTIAADATCCINPEQQQPLSMHHHSPGSYQQQQKQIPHAAPLSISVGRLRIEDDKTNICPLSPLPQLPLQTTHQYPKQPVDPQPTLFTPNQLDLNQPIRFNQNHQPPLCHQPGLSASPFKHDELCQHSQCPTATYSLPPLPRPECKDSHIDTHSPQFSLPARLKFKGTTSLRNHPYPLPVVGTYPSTLPATLASTTRLTSAPCGNTFIPHPIPAFNPDSVLETSSAPKHSSFTDQPIHALAFSTQQPRKRHSLPSFAELGLALDRMKHTVAHTNRSYQTPFPFVSDFAPAVRGSPSMISQCKVPSSTINSLEATVSLDDATNINPSPDTLLPSLSHSSLAFQPSSTNLNESVKYALPADYSYGTSNYSDLARSNYTQASHSIIGESDHRHAQYAWSQSYPDPTYHRDVQAYTSACCAEYSYPTHSSYPTYSPRYTHCYPPLNHDGYTSRSTTDPCQYHSPYWQVHSTQGPYSYPPSKINTDVAKKYIESPNRLFDHVPVDQNASRHHGASVKPPLSSVLTQLDAHSFHLEKTASKDSDNKSRISLGGLEPNIESEPFPHAALQNSTDSITKKCDSVIPITAVTVANPKPNFRRKYKSNATSTNNKIKDDCSNRRAAMNRFMNQFATVPQQIAILLKVVQDEPALREVLERRSSMSSLVTILIWLLSGLKKLVDVLVHGIKCQTNNRYIF
ncbi:hypothetical protein BDV3_002853 [Batrachochytrium dendrobatidis]|uniref:Uncharacterized protein n=1 Tax=Batrachochytrium dendrobatidis (strain JEL423) TaxID=403673 RepID=A0A177WYH1_BATDL|nr:hypothetical protein, variant 2 [Batrachochytrium dendrobatidis JEL423]